VRRLLAFAEMCSGSEAGSYLRLIDFCIDLVGAGVDGGLAVWRLLARVLHVAHAALVVQRLFSPGEPLRGVLDVVPSLAARGQKCAAVPRRARI